MAFSLFELSRFLGKGGVMILTKISGLLLAAIATQMIMDAVGLTNIAAGVRDTWSSFSWEQVAADDPDVIVLVDATWNSAAKKRELLATSPATANLTAVREERYLVVPFPATEAGVRNVPAALDLAAQLAALDL